VSIYLFFADAVRKFIPPEDGQMSMAHLTVVAGIVVAEVTEKSYPKPLQ